MRRVGILNLCKPLLVVAISAKLRLLYVLPFQFPFPAVRFGFFYSSSVVQMRLPPLCKRIAFPLYPANPSLVSKINVWSFFLNFLTSTPRYLRHTHTSLRHDFF